MRKLSIILVAGMFMLSANVSANDFETKKPVKSLSEQIGTLLEKNVFVIEGDEDLTASVRLMLNDEGEIVVLNVATEEDQLERFVKARLNYQKVESGSYKKGRVYTVPVRIQA